MISKVCKLFQERKIALDQFPFVGQSCFVFIVLGTYLTTPKLRRAAKPPSHRKAASSADADMEKLPDTLTILYVENNILVPEATQEKY